MDSDTNSTITVYHTISQFENSDQESPDEFDNSEPSPSTFSQPPFQPLHSQTRDEPPSTPSYISNVTPTYSPLTSERSNNNSPEDTQISYELETFITLQQQLQPPQTLTIHQLSQSIVSSNQSTPTSSSNPFATPNFQVKPILIQYKPSIPNLQKKFPDHPFPSHPGAARTYINHPNHTNTNEFLKVYLPFFPQYKYFYSDPSD